MLYTIVILMQFSAATRPGLAAQVEREMNLIFAPTKIHFVVMRQARDVLIGQADDVVHVDIVGSCAASGTSRGGVLGAAVRLPSEVQSFITVHCDTLSAYVAYPSGIGKAVGRVLAHEMLHYLLQEPHHFGDRLFKTKLTRKDLVDASVELSPEVIGKLNALSWASLQR